MPTDQQSREFGERTALRPQVGALDPVTDLEQAPGSLGAPSSHGASRRLGSLNQKQLDPLPRIIRRIPRECFHLTPWKSIVALFVDFAVIGLLMFAIVKVHLWTVALPLAILMGTVMTGLFVLGHDAGHRSFSYSEKVNNFFGHLATTPLLWPFHVWRLSHDVHHRWTHHVEKEIAWKPLTTIEFEKAPYIVQIVYRYTRTFLFFWASVFFQAAYIVDGVKGRFFAPEDQAKIKFSLRLTFIFAVGYVAATFWVAGFYGFFWLFLVPQLTYQFWLSTFTFFHHTNAANTLMSAQDWTPEKAQLACTVHVAHHPMVDLLTHDIAWHVPHHVCVGIPFYHLRKAHGALKAAYPEWVVERKFGRELIREVIDQCHLVAGHDPLNQSWVQFAGSQSMLAHSEGESHRA